MTSDLSQAAHPLIAFNFGGNLEQFTEACLDDTAPGMTPAEYLLPTNPGDDEVIK